MSISLGRALLAIEAALPAAWCRRTAGRVRSREPHGLREFDRLESEPDLLGIRRRPRHHFFLTAITQLADTH